jgi:regulator of sigma E protease
MTVILFIIILGILVFVHELGHFLVAKFFNIKVDEFGIGFPPRLAKLFKIGETEYTLNWIPFGGFVKIFGETPDDESIDGPERDRSFVHKHPLKQIAVLVAGVTFNAIFAWLVISAGYMIGFPMPENNKYDLPVENAGLTVVNVSEDSPAETAGLMSGDKITVISNDEQTVVDPTFEELQQVVTATDVGPMLLTYTRGTESLDLLITPERSKEDEPLRIGVETERIGMTTLGPVEALSQGLVQTYDLTILITVEISKFIWQAITGSADYSQVAGPVGIAGLFGDASTLGAVYVLSLTALISLHLAIINLAPFPALDGGRIIFVIIEWITGKQLPVRAINIVNAVGFFLLIGLMVLVTINDVVRLV